MSCDVVIFDLDGVVLAPVANGGSIGHWRKIFEDDLGLPFDERTEHILHEHAGEFVPSILTLCYPEEDPWKLIERFQRVDTQKRYSLMDGAVEVILELHDRGKCLCLFTQRERVTSEYHLRTQGILKYFSVLHTLESYYPYGKKDVRSLKLLFRNVRVFGNILPGNCCFVGDSPGIDAHVALNQEDPPVFFGLAANKKIRQEFLAVGVPQDHIIDSLWELAALI